MKVIIVGGGPAGLVTAHALLRVGIDDITILERRNEPVEPSGAALGLWPHSVRILDQLGLYDAAQQIAPKLEKAVSLDPEGKLLEEGEMFTMVIENHGHGFMMMERMRFVELLYNRLPDNKTRVRTGMAVESIAQRDDGITVTCTDGSTLEADIVIGADGVYSTIRRLIFPGLSPTDNTKASSSSSSGGSTAPATEDAGSGGGGTAETTPFVSSYQCIFGISTLPPALPKHRMIETHNRRLSFHLLTLDERVCWFLFRRLDKPTNTRARYSDDDAQALAAEHAVHPVWRDGAVRFGDLWEARIRARLVNLEEGVVPADKWSSGRVVLLGDAVHKMTPNLAFGANTAIESAVVLANCLRPLRGEEAATTTAEIDAAFREYAQRRFKRAEHCVSVSGTYTRFAARNNWLWEFLGRWISPLLGPKMAVDRGFGPVAQGGEVLENVPELRRKEGKLKWVHEPKLCDA